MVIALPLYPRDSGDDKDGNPNSKDRGGEGQERESRNGRVPKAARIYEKGAKLPQAGNLKYVPPPSYERFDRQRDGLGRYRQRSYQRLDEEGQETLFIERRLQEQFGTHNSQDLPPQMGQQLYKESNWRRFSIIFFLAWPFTALYSYGILFSAKALGGDEGEALNREESWGLAGVSALLAALIGWYDHREAKMAALSTPIGRRDAGSERNFSAAAQQGDFLQNGTIGRQQGVAAPPDLRPYGRRYYYVWSYPFF